MLEHEDVRLVTIRSRDARLEGELAVPQAAIGLVAFAHGSGSSRLSPRNRTVAQSLRARARVGTLLFDLLSESEEREDLRTGHLRFDVDLLARRVLAATTWLREEPRTSRLPLGYFGASTGAAAALVAAAQRPDAVAAIVSRGGRPDLAGPRALRLVSAPALLVVGSEDHLVLDLNREAQKLLRCESRLDVIAGASHLFEEPGALEEVARRAADWFARCFERAPRAQPPHGTVAPR
jgi:pimeloyl-ACP methyl ester carboxylesterase